MKKVEIYVLYRTTIKWSYATMIGELIPEDTSMAIIKNEHISGNKWEIIDVASGIHIFNNGKTKKALLEKLREKLEDNQWLLRLKNARSCDTYKARVRE